MFRRRIVADLEAVDRVAADVDVGQERDEEPPDRQVALSFAGATPALECGD